MGYTLAQLRVGRNWTQQEAGNAVGVSAAAWSKWEKHKSFPTQPKIDAILKTFNVAYDDIIF